VGVDVTGSPAGPIRSAIADVLKHHGYEVGPVDLSSDSEDAVAAAAKKGKLAAIVVGEVKEGGKRAKIRVYGANGDLIGEGSWTEKGGPKKLAAAVERTLWARVGSSLSKAKAGDSEGAKAPKAAPAAADNRQEKEKEKEAEPEAEKPEEKSTYSRSEESEKSEKSSDADEGSSKKKRKKKKKVEDDEESADTTPALAALDLGVGVRGISRTLTWPNNNVRGYNMGLAPALGVTLAWYPIAHMHGGLLSNIGLAASAEFLPGYQSKTGDGTKYPTQENDYWGGLRGRLPIGPVEAALTLGGGQHAFVFRSGSMPRSTLGDLPDVAYTYARAGLDLKIALPANLSLALGGGYRAVLGAGNKNYLLEAPGFFPNAKVAGFDVTVGLGYRLLSFLEARGGFDLRRYAIKTNASGAQPMTATGVDQTIALWASLAVIIDGAGGGAAAAHSEKAPKAEPSDEDESQKSGAKDSKSGDDE
jgi:hypothetical protein